ncbi:hypothetical protein AKJ09_02022 [Labilithrix luteola]|uniref:Uncharacterized protein n=1 Tax=Labilithrix luteola TaxID=1391654 RepID=A0A0K1PPA5_9BACT|nr:hypothetical protein AKJ09_02022 [Labilithrix luteola]
MQSGASSRYGAMVVPLDRELVELLLPSLAPNAPMRAGRRPARGTSCGRAQARALLDRACIAIVRFRRSREGRGSP